MTTQNVMQKIWNLINWHKNQAPVNAPPEPQEWLDVTEDSTVSDNEKWRACQHDITYGVSQHESTENTVLLHVNHPAGQWIAEVFAYWFPEEKRVSLNENLKIIADIKPIREILTKNCLLNLYIEFWGTITPPQGTDGCDMFELMFIFRSAKTDDVTNQIPLDGFWNQITEHWYYVAKHTHNLPMDTFGHVEVSLDELKERLVEVYGVDLGCCKISEIHLGIETSGGKGEMKAAFRNVALQKKTVQVDAA